MPELKLACPFDGSPMSLDTQRFICTKCEEALFSEMAPERRRAFHLYQNPWAFGLHPVMSPSEMEWFERLRTAAPGTFTQEIEVLDPGNPDNPDDRNPHVLILAIPSATFATAEEIEATARATFDTHAKTSLLAARKIVSDHLERCAQEATEWETQADDLLQAHRDGLPVDANEVVSLRRKARTRRAESAANPDEAVAIQLARIHPFEDRNNIWRLRRTISHVTMHLAVRFPTSEWSYFEPVRMSDEELAERTKLITEAVQRRHGESLNVAPPDEAQRPAEPAAPAPA